MEDLLNQTPEEEAKEKKTLASRIRDTRRWISRNWDWYNMNAKCVFGGVLLTVATLYGIGAGKVSEYFEAKNNLGNAKQEVLLKYGDANEDGYVSQAEKDYLFVDILKDKNVICISGEQPIYKDGKEVDRKEFTSWIRDYINSRE